MTLPTFLIIGAMKAGTTSLWSYLGAHPDIYVAPGKELNFFVAERNWSKGLGWYEGRFADARSPAKGEASPQYAMVHAFAGVPARIADVVPDVKIVYLIRHPIERMRSHYLHRVASGKEDRPIDRAFLEGLDYLHTSRYAFQLEPYLERFSRESILLVTSEDLRNVRAETLRAVFSFLEVDPNILPAGVEAEEHRTADKRVQSGIGRRLSAAAPTPLRRLISKVTTRTIDPESAVLSEDVRRRVADALRPDLERLKEIAGPGFDAWGLA